MVKSVTDTLGKDFFPETLKFLSVGKYHASFEVIKEYRLEGETRDIKEWHIVMCNGSPTPEELGVRLQDHFENELTILIDYLSRIDVKNQEAILCAQLGLLKGFRDQNFLTVTYNDIYAPSIHALIRFKTVEITALDPSLLEGMDDDIGEPNYSFRLELLWIGRAFAEKAKEVFDSYIHKLEFTFNNLHIIRLSNKSISISRPDQLSFKYSRIATQSTNVTDFYRALKKASLIHPSTKLSVFRNIVLGKKVDERIIWTGSIGALHLLIKTLNEQSKLIFEPNGIWDTTAYCFSQSGGIAFTSDQLRKAKSPKDSANLLKLCELL